MVGWWERERSWSTKGSQTVTPSEGEAVDTVRERRPLLHLAKDLCLISRRIATFEKAEVRGLFRRMECQKVALWQANELALHLAKGRKCNRRSE